MPASATRSAGLGRFAIRAASLAPAFEGEQLPFARYSFELVGASRIELDAGAGHQVLDSAGDQHFPGGRLRGHASTRVNRDSRNLPIRDLALARMQPRADREAEFARALDDRRRAAARA